MASERALQIIKEGSIRIRVNRSGMWQFQIFKIKRVMIGKDYFVELSLEKVLDMKELQRVANETDLPVEAENGRAFPTGKGAKDFLNVSAES